MLGLYLKRSRLYALSLTGLILVSIGSPTKAHQIEEYEIKSLGEVHTFLKHCSKESTVVVCDWDDVITGKDGDDTHFRQESTKMDIETIKALGFDFMILTSRFSGSSIEQLHPSNDNKKKTQALKHYMSEMDRTYNILQGYKTIKSCPSTAQKEDYDDILILDMRIYEDDKEKEAPTKDHMILTNNIIFAGSCEKERSNKGPALAKILDLNRQGSLDQEDEPIFTSDRVHTKVVFIDNDPDHIDSMRLAFKERSEDLLLLYYPKD